MSDLGKSVAFMHDFGDTIVRILECKGHEYVVINSYNNKKELFCSYIIVPEFSMMFYTLSEFYHYMNKLES